MADLQARQWLTQGVVNGSTCVIDCGRASVTQFAEVGLRFDSIRAFFLTHLHAEHVADYYNFFMLGGHIPNPYGNHISTPTPIYGVQTVQSLPRRAEPGPNRCRQRWSGSGWCSW